MSARRLLGALGLALGLGLTTPAPAMAANGPVDELAPAVPDPSFDTGSPWETIDDILQEVPGSGCDDPGWGDILICTCDDLMGSDCLSICTNPQQLARATTDRAIYALSTLRFQGMMDFSCD